MLRETRISRVYSVAFKNLETGALKVTELYVLAPTSQHTLTHKIQSSLQHCISHWNAKKYIPPPHFRCRPHFDYVD